MSRSDKWVPIDKNIVQEFKYIDRPFSRVEALVSFSIDWNCKCKWSLSGYAKQWQWSRCKVRKFVDDILSDKGHSLDRQKTHYRHPIHHIDLSLVPTLDTQETDARQSKDTKKVVQTPSERKTDARQTPDTQETDVRHLATSNDKGLPPTKDTQETDARQTSDKRAYTTKKNKNKNNNKKKNSATEKIIAPKTQPVYVTRKGKKLSGGKLVAFETFWEKFADKRGKAKAADCWLRIPGYTPALAKTISSAAKSFANHRPTIKAENLTPIMAEGWLSGRRWEDDLPIPGQGKGSAPSCQSCDYFVRKSCKGNRPKCGSYRPHSTKA